MHDAAFVGDAALIRDFAHNGTVYGFSFFIDF